MASRECPCKAATVENIRLFFSPGQSCLRGWLVRGVSAGVCLSRTPEGPMVWPGAGAWTVLCQGDLPTPISLWLGPLVFGLPGRVLGWRTGAHLC